MISRATACLFLAALSLGAASVPGAYAGVGALSQHPGAEGCVTADGTDGVAGLCRVGRGLDEINQVVISPDGRHLYSVANQNAHSIGVFAIDQGNGALTQLNGTDGCISDSGTDGTGGACADGRGLNEVGHLAISPDGKHVYASAAGDDLTEEGTLAIFSRDATTGKLTQLAGTDGCIRQTAAGADACAVGRGLAEPTSVTVSPDGKNVYATGSSGGTLEAVSVFTRDTSTGALTQLGGTAACVSHTGNDGCADGRALFEPTSVVVSNDNKHVYLAVSEAIPGPPHGPGAIASFSRDPTTGALTQLATTAGCNSSAAGEGCTTAKGLEDAITIAITPDDKHVYVAAQGANTAAVGVGALSAFTRDATTGALTQLGGTAGCVSKNGGDGSDAGVPGQCGTARSFIEPNGIAFGPGAGQVYVAAGDDRGAVVLGRDAGTGELAQLAGEDGCIRTAGGEGCKEGRALGAGVQQGSRDLAIGPNCNFLYVAARDTPGIAVLRRGCTPPTSVAATLPSCSTSGDVQVSVADAAGAVQAKRVRFRIDGGPEQTLVTGTGNPATATLSVPEGRHSIEYWGEDETGVQETLHHTVSAVVDRTAPAVSIQGGGALLVGDAASAVVSAADAISGLSSDPSAAAVPLDTSSAGDRQLSRSAVDLCGNTGAATFAYRVSARPVVAPPLPPPGPAPIARRRIAPSSVIAFPKRCTSRRRFRIRLRQPRGVRLRSAEVRVNNRRVRVVRGRRLRAPVDLRGLPKGRFTVTVRAVTTTGAVVTSRRAYRTCARKRRR